MDLEERVAELEAQLQTCMNVMQTARGHARIFEAAVLALIDTHPRPDLLQNSLNNLISIVEAAIVHESLSDAHVQAAQSAHRIITMALNQAFKRQQQTKDEMT
jgi:hypothetical protein